MITASVRKLSIKEFTISTLIKVSEYRLYYQHKKITQILRIVLYSNDGVKKIQKKKRK